MLLDTPPLEDGPAVLLQVGKPHWERAASRMREVHACAPPIFEEPCQKGDMGTLLFRSSDNVHTLLASILQDWPLCSVLTRAPFVASRCCLAQEQTAPNGTVPLPPPPPLELVAALRTACEEAVAQSHTVKLSAPAGIRRSLLAAIMAEAPEHAECLVATGADRVFHVSSVFRCAAYFYHTLAVPVYSPHAVLDEKLGHWHSPAQHDKSGSKSSVCRAYYKLSEALHEDPALAAFLLTAPGGKKACVDIGAAPGGWTDLLSRQPGCRVVAFDPGALDAAVVARPNVAHLPMLLSSDDGGESVRRLKDAMAPSLTLDVVVCDANIPPAVAAGLVAHLAACELLSDGCRLVLTLKSPLRVRASQAASVREQQREEAAAALGPGFGDDVSLRHLFANTQHECTLTAKYILTTTAGVGEHGSSLQEVL
jgi:23S rRNA U2552 (ribose-2'-O)-methylase RlmE/FtsJ